MTQGRKPKYDNKIVNLLKTKGALRASQVAKLIRIPYSQASNILKRMQEAGLVVKHGKVYLSADAKWKTVAMQTSATPIKTAESIEKTNPTVDALKAELDHIRATVNYLVQTGEYIKARIVELTE